MDSRKKNNEKKNNGSFQKVITDPRFASVHSDPRFQNPPKHKSKVTIDSRFNRMFTDKNFTASSTRIDKRGKVKKEDSVAKNPLKHYYRLDEEKKKGMDGGSDQSESDIGGSDKGDDESDGEIARLKKRRGNVASEDEESDESGSDVGDLEEDEGVESEEGDESDGQIAKLKNVKSKKVQVESSDEEMESDEEEEEEEDGVDEDSSSTGSEAEYLSEEENNLALVRF